jgi:hypothetical protein
LGVHGVEGEQASGHAQSGDHVLGDGCCNQSKYVNAWAAVQLNVG